MSELSIEQRSNLFLAGKQLDVSMAQLPAAIASALASVGELLAQAGAQFGPAVVRYHEIDMPDHLAVTVGFYVPSAMVPPVGCDLETLPGGRYVVVVHEGGYDTLIDSNAELQKLADDAGLRLDGERAASGLETWGVRVEEYTLGAETTPDPMHWRTNIAYRLID